MLCFELQVRGSCSLPAAGLLFLNQPSLAKPLPSNMCRGAHVLLRTSGHGAWPVGSCRARMSDQEESSVLVYVPDFPA